MNATWSSILMTGRQQVRAYPAIFPRLSPTIACRSPPIGDRHRPSYDKSLPIPPISTDCQPPVVWPVLHSSPIKNMCDCYPFFRQWSLVVFGLFFQKYNLESVSFQNKLINVVEILHEYVLWLLRFWLSTNILAIFLHQAAYIYPRPGNR